MSKRKSNKKINLRLRKQVRRTFGVLFMASAIVVSTIPVDDIEAGEKWDAVQNDPLLTDNRGAPSYPTIDSNTPGWVPSEPFLAKPSPLPNPGAAQKDYETSYTIYEVSSSTNPWVFVEQYYYTVHSNIPGSSGDLAIINGYSDLLPAERIKLNNFLAKEYYTVSELKFFEFFEKAEYTVNGTLTDNVSWPSGGPGAEDYTYSYDDYVAIDSEIGNLGETPDMQFIEQQEEWREDYLAYKEQCAKYYQYLKDEALYEELDEQYQLDHQAWVDGGEVGNEPQPPKAPDVVSPPGGEDKKPFVRSASQLASDKKRSFYCTWAESLTGRDENRIPGTGFTLTSVADNINGGFIYIPRGGQLSGDGESELDENGFLIMDLSEMVIGIGDEAFMGVGTVEQLTIPEEIKYIGDNAFSSSFIKSIQFANISKIGNQAFKNCTMLGSVTINDGARTIGVEAFRGSGISSISFPNSIDTIGVGAFSYSNKLTSVDMSIMEQEGTKIGDYAFYNCGLLSEVKFTELLNAYDIGEGCFALETAAEGALSTITLPKNISGVKGNALGNYLFAGRMGLKSVIMPDRYGTDRLKGTIQIPSGMFLSCTGLDFVEFPNVAGGWNGGFASFQYTDEITDVNYPGPDVDPYRGNYLFLDVTNPSFFVRGPELSTDGNKALPRRSTWSAFTKASDFVPYKYIDRTGLECYEVSDGQYILQANVNGELTDCELVDDVGFNGSNYVDLVIPGTVGDIKITDIASDALSNRNLRDRMRSLTISDYSLTAVADGAFKGLPRLEKVVIGNSVENIGAGAFEDCRLLTDITFHPPLVPYDQFVIGDGAFRTNSKKLVFNGDIQTGYAPFEFAMDPVQGNIAHDINGDPTGLRILYKSLSPTLLTVMYDNDAEEVVLLNYPKFDRLDDNNVAYRNNMKNYYTDLYSGGEYDGNRQNFVAEFQAAAGNVDQQEALYEDPNLYGPWISRSYLNDPNGDGKDDDKITGIEAYYERNEYSIIDNFYNTNPKDWERASLTESAMVNATKKITIPAGVTSIDANSYFDTSNGRVNSNRPNFSVYFNTNSPDTNPALNQEEYDMIMGSPGNTTENGIPVASGLFSGYYKDFDSENDNEEQIRGNDQIESIVMSTVKSLPPYAFDSCESLSQVVLGEALMDIGTAPFRGASRLHTVVGNEKYLVDKGIIYSRKADESYRLEQTLSARGALVGESYVTNETDPLLVNVSEIVKGAFEDCDVLNRVDLTGADLLRIIPENCFNDCKVLRNIRLPESVNRIEEGAFGMNDSLNVYIPGYEVYIDTNAFKLLPRTDDPTTSHTIQTYADTSAEEYAVYHRDTRGMGIDVELMNDRYMVDFLDHMGVPLIETQRVPWGEEAIPPDEEVMAAYMAELEAINRVFIEWSKPFDAIKEHTTIIALVKDLADTANKHRVVFYQRDGVSVIREQYVVHGESAIEPRPPVVSGYDFVGWAPSDFSNVQDDMTIVAIYERSDNSGRPGSTSSPRPSSSPSPSPGSGGTKYTVSVSGGSGSGSYTPGTVVTIGAFAAGDGRVFDRWTTASTGVGFLDATSPTTTFTMPAGNVTVTATYKTALSSSTGSGSASTNTSGGGNATGGSGSSGGSNSGTRVEVTKPGIPNTGLASATVNGSLDNFVVKITEDPAATALVVEALQKQYGDISNIRYLPMDISLYDSTGTVRITDTAGISVNITLPLPTDLVAYAGNNRVASAEGGQLENLNTRFTTIDGIPCVTFTATHFSPYTVYVDTLNLSEGMIDYTPQTGDLIHPKWFLVMGLASISLLLFLKKDKKIKLTPA